MPHLLRDVRYAFRGLARDPLFTLVALVSIAIGIGANTAIFTLVDEVLLRTLPVKNPEQLVLFNGARNHYGSNPSIVGRRLTINNYSFTVVGVSQPGFDGLDIGAVASVRVPVMLKAQMTPNWDDMDNRRSRWVNVFGRLKPGVTIEQAKAALQPFFHGLLEQEVLMPAFSTTSSYTREQFLAGRMDVLPAAQGRSPIRQQLSTRPSLAPTLKDQVGAVVGASGGVRLRKALVVTQVTISILLLIGAGLFIRSLRNLRQLDLGLKTSNLIAFNIAPGLSGYAP